MAGIAETKIVKLRTTGEWVVRAYDSRGIRQPQADYFTNDKKDAEDTAKMMVNMTMERPSFTTILELFKKHGDTPDSIQDVLRKVPYGQRIIDAIDWS